MKYKLRYSCQQLYQNCIYALCVHISTIPRLQMIAYEHSWDQISYSFQSCYSTDGTISFDFENNLVVGAFRKNDSSRLNEYPEKDALTYFMDADKKIKTVANQETFPYLLLSFEIKEKKNIFRTKIKEIIVPVVTTVFWSEGDDIYSSDDENSFLENGGKYMDSIYLSKKELTQLLMDDYELTSEELEFAETLFELKKSGQHQLDKKLFSNISNEESESHEDFLLALSDFHFEVM